MNPEWSDDELERWVREAREKLMKGIRRTAERNARVERSYAPIDTPPGKAGDEKVVETVWLVIGVVAVVLVGLCFYGALDLTPR